MSGGASRYLLRIGTALVAWGFHAQIGEKAAVFPPVLAHLHMKSEINVGVQEALDL
jgi:hypothetical protein